MRLSVVAFGLLGAFGLAPLDAQQAPVKRATAPASTRARLDSLRVRAGSDSAAQARILEHAWTLLAPHLLRASLDTTSQAWVFRLPGADPLMRRLEAHLITALRARAPQAADTAVFTFSVTPVTITGDTARATILLDYEHRCAPGARPGGWGNAHRVVAPRVGAAGPWGPARTLQVQHGDRARCRVPRP